MEEIVAEVDRLERRVESTTFLKTVDSASESDSDSSASDSSSDSDSDTDSESEYYGKMTDKVTTSYTFPGTVPFQFDSWDLQSLSPQNLSPLGPAELVPAKLVPVLKFFGAVPKLEEPAKYSASTILEYTTVPALQ